MLRTRQGEDGHFRGAIDPDRYVNRPDPPTYEDRGVVLRSQALQHREAPSGGCVEARKHNLTAVCVAGQDGGYVQRGCLCQPSWIVREQESCTSRAS